MTKTLEDLVDQLEEDVPARNNVPSTTQYERSVMEAVRDFSRRCGKKKRAELSIVSGTASYELPDDFLKMIQLISLTGVDGVINSNNGLIPVSSDFCEEYIIDDGQITFYPTPGYSMTREYTYKRAWIMTGDPGDEEFETMGEEEADIVLKKAKALCLDILAKDQAGRGFKYQIGDEMVDKSNVGTDFQKSVKGADDEYIEACDQYNGNTGRML